MNTLKALLVVGTGFIFGCSPIGSSGGSASISLTASDANVMTTQNTSVTIDLSPSVNSLSVVVVQAPVHGQISLDGKYATYRPTDPEYSGRDGFSFRLSNGSTQSNEASVAVTISPVTSGAYTFTENYPLQNFALSGWQQFSSVFGHTASSIASFATGTYNGSAVDTRHFGIYGDNSSYAGDGVYTGLFSTLPVDGAAGLMKDWPWKADLIHLPECGVDATITVKLKPNLGQYPMLGLLLNYDIVTKQSGAVELTGYQVLLNSGGGSLTLSRFDHANSLATAYLDRWPNTTYGNENNMNPVTSGPFKGWNYRNGVWPAGGNVGVGSEMFVAIHYQYDPLTQQTTISYEARHIDGTDDTPGVYDIVVHLTGVDSLAPGGSFGLMPLNYHTASSLNTTDFDIAEYKVQCNLP